MDSDYRTRDPGRGLLLGNAAADPQRLPGVVSTRVGYSGGDVKNATYRNHGTHAEAIEITFDPSQTTLPRSAGVLLPDPRPDDAEPSGKRRGASYRSAIFYTSDEQRRVAEDTIADVEASGLWPGKVVTEVAPAGAFLGGRARAPGLPGTLSERLHLPLRPPALEVAAEERRLTATAVSVACGGRSITAYAP